MMVALAMGLYSMHRKNGAPWLVASCFMALQALFVWFAYLVPGLDSAFAAYATIPDSATLVAGLAAGAAAGWFGGRAGGAPARPAAVPT